MVWMACGIPGFELYLLVGEALATDPRYTNKVELLLNATLAKDVHLLACRLELDLLEVASSSTRPSQHADLLRPLLPLLLLLLS